MRGCTRVHLNCMEKKTPKFKPLKPPKKKEEKKDREEFKKFGGREYKQWDGQKDISLVAVSKKIKDKKKKEKERIERLDFALKRDLVRAVSEKKKSKPKVGKYDDIEKVNLVTLKPIFANPKVFKRTKEGLFTVYHTIIHGKKGWTEDRKKRHKRDILIAILVTSLVLLLCIFVIYCIVSDIVKGVV